MRSGRHRGISGGGPAAFLRRFRSGTRIAVLAIARAEKATAIRDSGTRSPGHRGGWSDKGISSDRVTSPTETSHGAVSVATNETG